MKSAMTFFLAAALVIMGAVFVFPQSARVKNGREVYALQKCALCHSISGIGGKKMPLDGVGSKLDSEEIKKWI